MNDDIGREVYIDDELCDCDMPCWTMKDMLHCAKCGKLLPDVKQGEIK